MRRIRRSRVLPALALSLALGGCMSVGGESADEKTGDDSANVSEVVRATGALNENRLVSVAVDGVPVDPAATYRVAMNEFLGGGGDGFTAIRNGTKVFVGHSDLDVLIAYLGAHSSQAAPYPVPTGGRIVIGG